MGANSIGGQHASKWMDSIDHFAFIEIAATFFECRSLADNRRRATIHGRLLPLGRKYFLWHRLLRPLITRASSLGLCDPARRSASIPRGAIGRSSVLARRLALLPQRHGPRPHRSRRHQHRRVADDPLLALAQ